MYSNCANVEFCVIGQVISPLWAWVPHLWNQVVKNAHSCPTSKTYYLKYRDFNIKYIIITAATWALKSRVKYFINARVSFLFELFQIIALAINWHYRFIYGMLAILKNLQNFVLSQSKWLRVIKELVFMVFRFRLSRDRLQTDKCKTFL